MIINRISGAKSRHRGAQAVITLITGLFLTFAGPIVQAQTATGSTMAGPIRLAESPMGLLVGDYVGFKMVVLNPETLEATDTFSTTSKPLSVAWGNDRIYVGDEKTGFIEVYEKVRLKGKDAKIPGDKKSKYGWVQATGNLTSVPVPQPSDIAIDESSGLLFIASKIDKKVSVFDPSGTLLRTIGDPDSDAALGRPQGLALDRAGQRIFVSDDGIEQCSWMGCSTSSGILIYDYDGTLLDSISGSAAESNFKFSRAQGLTLDSGGRIYLVDSFRSEVLVFEETEPSTWTGIGRFGTKGTGHKQLLLPMDVIFDELSSKIYVTSAMTGRVDAFTMGDMLP